MERLPCNVVVLYLVFCNTEDRKRTKWYQILFADIGTIAIAFFCLLFYKTCSYSWCLSVFRIRILGRGVSIVAVLTLEIYVVQFSVITNCFNHLFPLNIFIVFVLITISAYMLKVLTSLFLAVLSKEHLMWNDIVKV